MRSNRTFIWPAISLFAVVFILFTALPTSWKFWAPSFFQPVLHFGLDLVGGTQLDFRISEEEINTQLSEIREQMAQLESDGASSDDLSPLLIQERAILDQKSNLVEAIRTVLERRINALGVSEAIITPSYLGGERHLLVECPGVVDTQECIRTIGKTIQLEFKEQFIEATEEYRAKIDKQVDHALDRITQSGHTLHMVGQDLGDNLGIAYIDSRPYFREDVPIGLDSLWSIQPKSTVYSRKGSVTVTRQNPETGEREEEQIEGVFLAQVTRARTQTGQLITNPREAFEIVADRDSQIRYKQYKKANLDEFDPLATQALRGMQEGQMRAVPLSDGAANILFLLERIPVQKAVNIRHILIAYKGASNASDSIERSKEEARKKTERLGIQLRAGMDFGKIAKEESDAASAKDGGDIGAITHGMMPPSFEEVAFSLEPGVVSSAVESPFGYHLILAKDSSYSTTGFATFDELRVEGANALERASATISSIQRGKVEVIKEAAFFRSLFFSYRPTGWKNTSLDGKNFRSATVTLDPTTNIPVVQINFDNEGGEIFRQLTQRNVGNQIAIFVGGELISAPTVQQEIIGGQAIITGMRNFDDAKQLAQDLNTGAIPAPIHLTGQHTVEATLGAEALRTSLQAALIGALILMAYMLLMYRAIGLIADLALISYGVIFLTILKLPLFLFSGQYIVLTLAGMAGIILSIGMAVDANVLIFERIKEELRKGKHLRTAVETGFSRAWPSIRDSNISTLLTCAILFTIGTSIVRGFAVTLGMGVLISLFTATVLTRCMLRLLAKTEWVEEKWIISYRKSKM